MLTNQNQPQLLNQNQHQQQMEPLDQKDHLTKFGLTTKNEKKQQPKDKGWFKKTELKQFGYDREEKFAEELKKTELLLKHCEDNLLFEPDEWKKNDVRWKSQLESLAVAAGNLSKIRIHRMTQEINNPKEKPSFFKKIFRFKKDGS